MSTKMLPSYRNQSIDLQSKAITGFYMRATLAYFLFLNDFAYFSETRVSRVSLIGCVGTRTKYSAQKMKFSIKDFFTFTEEILNGKLHFLCSDTQWER